MTKQNAIAQDAQHSCLERALTQLRGEQCAITDIRRVQCSYSSYWRSEIITVRVTTGEEVKFFAKEFSTNSRQTRPDLAQRGARELRVYRDLFDGAGLGTAMYYGSHAAESEGRFTVLLEFVRGMPLRHFGTEERILAAAWLGRLHGYFVRESQRVLACDVLSRHDEQFYWSNADSAIDAVSMYSVPLADRLERVLRHYVDAVHVMAHQPVALVHGCFTPTQILYNAEGGRICPIDWEGAALGSPFYDLAKLSDGYDPPKLYRFFDAYTEAALEHGISVPRREEMKRIVDCFRLCTAKNALSKCARKGYSERSVVRLVEVCEQLRNLLF